MSKIIIAWLDDAEADLQLAELGIGVNNRHAPFHLQQAAEKLVKAVWIHRGLLPTKEHRIENLVDGDYSGSPGLPEGDPWREPLLALSDLSQYATAYRYPTSAGKLKRPPEAAELNAWVQQLRELLARARRELLADSGA